MFCIMQSGRNDITFPRTIDGETSIVCDSIESSTIIATDGFFTNVNGSPFDYKQGIFTPNLCAADGGMSGVPAFTYTKQIGNYVKIGRALILNVELEWNVTGGSATAGYGMTIDGLPQLTNGASETLSSETVLGNTRPNNDLTILPFQVNYVEGIHVFQFCAYKQNNSTPFYQQYTPIIWSNSGTPFQTVSFCLTAFI